MPFPHHPPGPFRSRPPWWPRDEPWPPAGPPGAGHGRRMRGRFFLRMAATFLVLFVLSVGGCTLIFWLGASLAGLVQLPVDAQTVARYIGIAALVVGAAGLVGIWTVLRRLANPLGELMEASGRVADGDYATRVPERGSREVRSLYHAFNTMTARLEQNEEQRRRLLADVTHELRTPLTVIQGNLEGLLDGLYPRDDEHLASLLDETRVLSRLVEDLRTLSLAESGALKLQREPTDLAALLDNTAAAFRAQAEAAQVALTIEAAPDLPLLDIDPVRIREVTANLVANALRYTPPGGSIRAAAALEQGGQQVVVSVSDSGRGIAPEDLPHVFDRFYKSADSRGSGLGLAIAKNLVAAHGGEIAAHSAGAGTTLTFTLPADR
jgi:signal transduction histidine kinase